jgi:hypothetical protein
MALKTQLGQTSHKGMSNQTISTSLQVHMIMALGTQFQKYCSWIINEKAAKAS